MLNEQNSDEKNVIQPEFVVIDERNGEAEFTHFDSEANRIPKPIYYREETTRQTTSGGGASLRFFCFLGLIFCTIFGFGMLLLSSFMTLLATASLFRNAKLNEGFLTFWKLTIHTLMAGIGFTLGILIPTLGLGFIILYFSLTGAVINNQLFNSILRKTSEQPE